MPIWLNTIDPLHIFRVWKEGKSKLQILYVNDAITTYECGTEKNREEMIEELKDYCASKRLCLEVYNGIDEAKDRR